MTGKISLRGLVLPIGGVKEKVCWPPAAPGSRRVMLPARNRRDLDDIPQARPQQLLEFVWLEQVDDAVAAALEVPRSKASRGFNHEGDFAFSGCKINAAQIPE